MNPNIASLISQYHEEGILIDTNLLLVLLVGNVEPRLIGKAAGTKGSSIEDYERIKNILKCFSRLVTVPQILTETAYFLTTHCTANTRLDLRQELARYVFLKETKEARVMSRRIAMHRSFDKLGYTDAAILTANAGKYLLLTADNGLQNFAGSMGIAVLPFQWLRAM